MEKTKHGNVVVLKLATPGSDPDMLELQSELSAALAKDELLRIIDASNVRLLGSALIGILISHIQQVEQAGGRVVFYGLRPRDIQELRLLGVESMFGTCATLEEGVAALAGGRPQVQKKAPAGIERRKAPRVPMEQDLWVLGGRDFYHGYRYPTRTVDVSANGLSFICCACGTRECFALSEGVAGCALKEYSACQPGAPSLLVSLGDERSIKATAKIVHLERVPIGAGARAGAVFTGVEDKDKKALGQLLAGQAEA